MARGDNRTAVSVFPGGEPSGGVDVGPSNDAERPVAVRLVASGPLENLTRADAWRLCYLLQAELVRTLPYPPSNPRTAGP